MRKPVRVLLVLLLATTLPASPVAATHPGTNGVIVLDSIDGGGVTVVGPDGTLTEIAEGGAIHLEASPDGRTALMVGGEPSDVRLISLAGGPTNTLIPRERGGRPDVSWSPDGSRFLVADGRAITTYDTQGLDPQVVYDVQADPNESNGFDAAVWTAANEVIAVNSFGGIRIDVASGQIVNLDFDFQEFGVDDQFGLDSSPDGQQVVISCGTQSQGQEPTNGICILNRDLTLVRLLPQTVVDGAFRILKPAWSPDGTRLAFIALLPDEVARLYTSAIDGSDPRMLADLPADDRFQGNFPGLQSWAPVSATPPVPLPEPPPAPTNTALECSGFDADPTTTERADFDDHIRYAVAVSQARFGCGDDERMADHVVLSRDDAFADSLVGAALTGDGPLLFTRTDDLPSETAAEIQRLLNDGDIIYLLGGTAAISQEVADLLTAFDVRRLAGPSRVETSVAVAEEALRRGADGSTLAVARAGGPADNPTAGWADSVSGGAWTAATGTPTVVTDTASLHPAVQGLLDRQEFTETVLFGGEFALSSAVADGVPGPRRIAGASRAGTAQAVASDLIGIDHGDDDRALIAINGFRPDGWLFGLPAAGLAADAGAAIVMAQSPVPPEALAMACSPDDVDLLIAGGFRALDQQAADDLDAAPAC